MAHRKALAVSGAISVSAMAAALAIGANFGLFGLATHTTTVGNFQPAATAELQTDAPSSKATPAAPSQPQPAQAVQLPTPASIDSPPAPDPAAASQTRPGPSTAASAASAHHTATPRRPAARPTTATTTRTIEDHSGRSNDHGGDDD